MLPRRVEYSIALCIMFIIQKRKASATAEIRYIKEGHNANLSCPGSPVATWNDMNSKRVIAKCIPRPETNSLLSYSDRISVDDRCRVTIANFTSGDMRSLLCITTRPYSYQIDIILWAPPSEIHVLEADSNGIIYSAEGHNVTMTCKVKSGNPPETMFWIASQNIVQAGGPSQLQYRFVAGLNNNMQKYTCSVNNSDGEPLICTVTLELIEKPKDVWILIKPSPPVKRGEHVELKCLHTAKQVHGYIWKHNGENLPGHNQTIVIHTVLPSTIGNYTCSVINVAGKGRGNTYLTMATHPIVHNLSITFNGTEMHRLLMCKVSGEPTKYEFKKWCHYSPSGQLLRELDSTDDGKLLLPTEVHQGIRYEDSGKYVCNVTNGIPDKHGRLWLSGEIIVSIKGDPVLADSMNSIQYGLFNSTTIIQISVLSLTDIDYTQWYNDKMEFISSGNVLSTKVWANFFNQKVHMNGYNCELKIENTREEDFRNYTLEVGNRIGKSMFNVVLQSANIPEIPEIVSLETSTKQIIVKWKSTFDGGYSQQFVIEYRKSSDAYWRTHYIVDDGIRGLKIAIIDGLELDTSYRIRMFAMNTIGNTSFTSEFGIRTKDWMPFLRMLCKQVLLLETIFIIRQVIS